MYASVANMIERFGETELLRLSNPEDRTAAAVDPAPVEIALADATATIDSFLRARYALPVANPPLDIVRATCVLARYDLASNGRSDPTDPMIEARKEIMVWLKAISKNEIDLDIPARDGGAPDTSRGARVTDRTPKFRNSDLARL